MVRKYNLVKKILTILFAFLIINRQMVAFARAGGGGGGGGGSSSGGRTSSSHSSGGRTSRTSFDPIEFLIFLGVTWAGTIAYRIRLVKKKTESAVTIKQLARVDENWNYKSIKKDIKETFYKYKVLDLLHNNCCGVFLLLNINLHNLT